MRGALTLGAQSIQLEDLHVAMPDGLALEGLSDPDGRHERLLAAVELADRVL